LSLVDLLLCRIVKAPDGNAKKGRKWNFIGTNFETGVGLVIKSRNFSEKMHIQMFLERVGETGERKGGREDERRIE